MRGKLVHLVHGNTDLRRRLVERVGERVEMILLRGWMGWPRAAAS